MKTIAKAHFELVEVQFIPEIMEENKIYYSKEYNITNHLCACGCGSQTPLPIKEGEWSISLNGDKISISPSIQHRYNCRSHYVITNGVANILNYPIDKKDWNVRYGFQSAQPG